MSCFLSVPPPSKFTTISIYSLSQLAWSLWPNSLRIGLLTVKNFFRTQDIKFLLKKPWLIFIVRSLQEHLFPSAQRFLLTTNLQTTASKSFKLISKILLLCWNIRSSKTKRQQHEMSFWIEWTAICKKDVVKDVSLQEEKQIVTCLCTILYNHVLHIHSFELAYLPTS